MLYDRTMYILCSKCFTFKLKNQKIKVKLDFLKQSLRLSDNT